MQNWMTKCKRDWWIARSGAQWREEIMNRVNYGCSDAFMAMHIVCLIAVSCHANWRLKPIAIGLIERQTERVHSQLRLGQRYFGGVHTSSLSSWFPLHLKFVHLTRIQLFENLETLTVIQFCCFQSVQTNWNLNAHRFMLSNL